MLARMKSHALLFLGALLASSAWAQEPSFDLKDDAIRKIVRDIAASQSVPVQLAAAKPIERKLVLDAEDLHPVERPINLPPPPHNPAPKSQGPVSALIETLIDSALGLDEEPTAEERYDEWLYCQQAGDDLLSTAQRVATCSR
jgi:hypothetical protein